MALTPSLIGELSRVGCVAVSAKRAVRFPWAGPAHEQLRLFFARQ